MAEKVYNNVKITSSFDTAPTKKDLESGATIGTLFGQINKNLKDLDKREKVLTKAEYDALTSDEQNNGTTYYISDGGDSPSTNPDEYYNKTEIDTKFNNYYDKARVDSKIQEETGCIAKVVGDGTVPINGNGTVTIPDKYAGKGSFFLVVRSVSNPPMAIYKVCSSMAHWTNLELFFDAGNDIRVTIDASGTGLAIKGEDHSAVVYTLWSFLC